MSTEQGYRLARFQRPGRKIVMGPDTALDIQIAALPKHVIFQLPGEASWLARDLRQRFGFVPSPWALVFISLSARHGHRTTRAEATWLQKQASLDAAGNWPRDIREGQTS